MKNTRFITNMLYKLKKDYGETLHYITLISSSADDDTGQRFIIKQANNIIAVPLPKTLERKFIQDIGYLAANKNFTYGALNDYSTIKFIVDHKDIPKNLNPDLNGYLVFNGVRYEKSKFEMLINNVSWILTAKAVEGAKPYDITPVRTGNNLQIQSGVSYELN